MFRAYFKNANNVADRAGINAGVMQPDSTPIYSTHKGKDYVVLHNVNGVLAVYRIKKNGSLKNLVRWPNTLNEI